MCIRVGGRTDQFLTYIALLLQLPRHALHAHVPSRNYYYNNAQLHSRAAAAAVAASVDALAGLLTDGKASVLGHRYACLNHRNAVAGSSLHFQWPTWHITGQAAVAAAVTAIDQSSYDDVLARSAILLTNRSARRLYRSSAGGDGCDGRRQRRAEGRHRQTEAAAGGGAAATGGGKAVHDGRSHWRSVRRRTRISVAVRLLNNFIESEAKRIYYR